MNIGGGEAADQMVRMLLSGTEVVIRPVSYTHLTLPTNSLV